MRGVIRIVITALPQSFVKVTPQASGPAWCVCAGGGSSSQPSQGPTNVPTQPGTTPVPSQPREYSSTFSTPGILQYLLNLGILQYLLNLGILQYLLNLGILQYLLNLGILQYLLNLGILQYLLKAQDPPKDRIVEVGRILLVTLPIQVHSSRLSML